MLFFVTIMSGFWIVFFYKKANRMYKAHLDAKETNINDRKPHIRHFLISFYKTQYIKNILLLTNTVLEFFAAICYFLHYTLPQSDLTLEYIGNPELNLEICSEANLTEYQELSNFSWFNLTQLLIELSNVSSILSSVIGVALMRLIISELKFNNPWERTKKILLKDTLLCIGLISTVMLLTVISYTWLIAMLICGILTIIYYTLFIREVRRVQAALAQYSRERLVQFGNNKIELIQLRRFKILSNIFCIGLVIGMISLLFEKIDIILSLILYYGQCYANLTFHIQYAPILHSVPQQLILFKVLFYFSRVKLAIRVLATVIIGVPFVLVTLVYMIFLIHYYYIRKFQTRFHVEVSKDNLLVLK